MTQGEKIQILLSNIEESLTLTAEQWESVYKSLINGQLRIAQMEDAYARAASPYEYYPVELVQEGFAFWNCGGGQAVKGHAVMAAGHNLQKLKVIRTMKEKNGRHSLCLIYQGCFLAQVDILPDGSEYVNVLQVIGFVGRDNGCQAKCQTLLTMTPTATHSKIKTEIEIDFTPLIRAAYHVACSEDYIKIEYSLG